jgi:chemotaxis signal transduction protein
MIPQRGKLDWEEVKARLLRAHIRTEKQSLGTGDMEEILKARAQYWARERKNPEIASGGGWMFLFALDGQNFSLPLDRISEITTAKNCTRVPKSPAEIFGITHLRDELLCVLNLAKILHTSSNREEEVSGSRENAEKKEGFLVILKDPRLALKIDSCNRIYFFNDTELAGNSAKLHFQNPLIKGIAAESSLLLDLGELANHPIFQEAN